jgi:hypothetical protein
MSHPPPGQYVPPTKQGHALELVLGAVLGGVDAVLVTFLAIGLGRSTGLMVGFLIGAVVGLLPVVLLFRTSTRWWGVGLLLGFFLTLIVLGGACVALLSIVAG